MFLQKEPATEEDYLKLMESKSAISLARKEECKGEWLTKEYKRQKKVKW